MTSFVLAPAADFAAADLHAACVEAFSDYVAGPMQMTLAQWPSFVARQGVDLERSRVAVRDGAVIAFGFACPRVDDGRWRLAVMGALPAARGSGAAQALLADFLARAKSAGMTHAELECFAANERALRLYRRVGFEVVHPLNGWKLPDAAIAPARGARAPGARDVREIDRATAFAWLDEADRRIPWLPFPNTARCQSAQVRPLTFWQCGSALLLFSAVEDTPTHIHVLIDLDPALRDAETLAHAIRAAHPDAFAPPILRDDLGGAALARAGFVQQELGQVLMRRAL
ncbi:MAG TPA: GNAT family N-acetyltransferase [Burkholderiaceae bacterium]|jgi:GNAT superfamily N-acetyltransferase|nr:GNAT family N-acetyltransferase [Burkholderiaceae bacterium]